MQKRREAKTLGGIEMDEKKKCEKKSLGMPKILRLDVYNMYVPIAVDYHYYVEVEADESTWGDASHNTQ